MAIGSGGGELEKVMLIISWAGDDQFEVHNIPEIVTDSVPAVEVRRGTLGKTRHISAKVGQNLSKCSNAYATQFWG
jgi:hypothetical protein